jgi:hypothetical protein
VRQGLDVSLLDKKKLAAAMFKKAKKEARSSLAQIEFDFSFSDNCPD